MIKEKHTIYNFSTLIFLWIFFLISPFFGSLRLFVIANFNTLVFVRYFFSLAYKVFPYIAIALIVYLFFKLIKNLKKHGLTALNRKTVLLLAASSIFFVVLFEYLLVLEKLNYSNYLYSHFGFIKFDAQRNSVVAQMMLALSVSVLFIFSEKSLKSPHLFKKKNTFNLLFIKRIIIFSVILTLIEQSFLTFINMKSYRKASDEGFEQKLGTQFKYIEALKNETPVNSTIVNPPQTSQWPSIGNQPILRYFLYPRKLVSGSIVSSEVVAKSNIGEGYFVLINDSNIKTNWPVIDKKTSQVKFNENDFIHYMSIEETINNNGILIYKIVF